jgi:tyrosine-protein phosphatase SIW14
MTPSRTSKYAALFCVLVASLVSAQAPDSRQAVAGATQAVAGATNFQRLDANFASGGATTPDGFAALEKLGFRTVINLRTPSEPGADLEAEAKTLSQTGLKYVSLPFSPGAPDVAAVDKFLQVVRDSANQPVYIHCLSGQRANAFWLIKRVMVDGWPTDKALAEADALKMTNQRLRDFALAYLKDHEK